MDDTRRKLYTRTRVGCLACRRRHKKCDERHPTCVGCERNQLICKWPVSSPGLEHVQQDHDPKIAIVSSKSKVSKVQHNMKHSCPPSVSGVPALFRHPPSARLVDFYVHETAQKIIFRNKTENPFVTHYMRIAAASFSSSAALQHAILAVSSSHRAFRDPAYIVSSYEHYAVALRLLKNGITKWDTASGLERVTLLGASLTLCWYEVIDANQKGVVCHHLRASALMLARLQNDNDWRTSQLLGFFLEQYTYLSTICHIGIGFEDDPLPLLSHNYNNNNLEKLNQGSSIYGFLLGTSHQIYQSIPLIRALAHRIRIDGPSAQTQSDFCILEHRIRHWQPAPADRGTDYEHGGRMYQAACLIFLYMAVSATSDSAGNIEACLVCFLDSFAALSSSEPSCYSPWTTFMWPTLIAGSCMRRTDQRERLLATLYESVLRLFQMQLVLNTADWLVLHWQKMDQDPSHFGPFALEDTIRGLGLVPCIG